jgi:hypothetical protein
MSTMMQYLTKAGQFNNDITSGSSPVVMTDEIIKAGKIINMCSGFSVYHDNDFLELEPSDSQADQARALTLSKTVAMVTYGLSYSQKTTTLFNMYNTNSEVVRNFDYREEVYTDFKRNLGHPNLVLLLEAQLHNNFLTTTHVAYLKETLEFISGYTDHRPVSNETWSTLLYHYNGDFVRGHADLKGILDKRRYPVIEAPVEGLIALWVSTSASISDLIWFNRLVWGMTPLGRIQ